MTFTWLLAKLSFSMTFPGLDFIFSFSMVFHDFPWPWEPWSTHNNTWTAKLNKLKCHPLECMSPHRDPQLQVAENYSYMFNMRPTIWKSMFNPFKPEFTIVIVSSTTSRELLSQFSTCSGWKWFESGDKWKKYTVIFKTVPWKFLFWNHQVSGN